MRLPRASVGLLAALLAACPSEAARRDAGSAEPPPREGGELRVVVAEDLESLDPHRAVRPPSWFVARAVHRGLLAFPDRPPPAGATPVPDLARALPTASADGRTLVFRLRDDARFAGGAAVTAVDARASLERLIRAGAGIAPALAVVSGIRAQGRRTLVLRLSRPAPDLPWVLAHPQAAIVPRGTRPPGTAAPASIRGAGPYRLRAYRPERSILLVRNDDWSEDTDAVRPARLDRIRISVAGSGPAAVAAMGSGRADLLLDRGPPDVAPAPPRSRRLRVASAVGSCTRYLFLNRDVPPFGNVWARRAVAHAVQRAPLAREGYAPAKGVLPPVVLGTQNALALEEDPQAARRALARAGLPRGFTTTLVVAATERDRSEAVASQRSLARVGIRVRVAAVAPALLLERYGSPRARVPMGIATWCGEWPGLGGRAALSPLVGPDGFARAPRPSVVGRAERARVEAAVRAWMAADRAVASAASIVPLTWPSESVSLSARTLGWTGSPMWPRGDPTALWVER